MNRKAKKVLIAVSSLSLVTTIIAVPVVVTQVNKNDIISSSSGDNRTFFWLDNSSGSPLKFNNIDEAANFILGDESYHGKKSGNEIRYQSYIGDFSKSINPLYNTIDTTNLYPYKKDYVFDAYRTLNGNYVDNLYFAAKSYLEKYRNEWMDANGDLHIKQSDAIKANKEFMENKTLGVSFYRILDKSLSKEFQINPLNVDDINTFKKIALRNLNNNTNNEFDIVKLYGTESFFVPINSIFSTGSYSSFVNTIYNLLSVFSKYKNLLTYDINASLTNNNWNYKSHTFFKRYIVPGSYGSKYYFLAQTDSKYQKMSETMRYEIFEYNLDTQKETKINNIKLSNLSSDDFVKKANIFINQYDFKKNATVSNHSWKGELNSYPNTTYIKDSNGKEYSITIGRKKYSFRINRTNNIDNYFLYGDHLRLLDKIDSSKDSSLFTLSVRTNNNRININSLKKEVFNVIFNDFILNNSDFEWIMQINPSVANSVREFINNEVTNIANKITDDFLWAISQTTLNFGDDSSSVTKDLTTTFNTNDDVNTRIKKIKELGTEWWIQKMYDNRTFNSLQTFFQNFYPALEGNSNLNNIAITYNSVPVFMIENISDIIGNKNLSNSEIKTKLNEWLYSDKYDSRKIVNISNKIKYESRTNNFSLSKHNKTITQFQNPDSNIKLKRVKLSTNFSPSEINKFQHLLLSQDDTLDMFRNDTGIESAIDIYNDNINEILSLKNSSVYIDRINDNNLLDPDNVLRLYNKPIDNSEFNFSPLPVNYGEMRRSTGLFNPSLSNKNMIFYKSQLESIVKYVEPVEVPIVDINGSSYFLAHIANGPTSSVLTGNLTELLNNATNNILSYMQPSNEVVFYQNEYTEKKLIKNDVKVICGIEFDGEYMSTLWPDGFLFSEERMFFLQYSDLYNYVKMVLNKKGYYGKKNPFGGYNE